MDLPPVPLSLVKSPPCVYCGGNVQDELLLLGRLCVQRCFAQAPALHKSDHFYECTSAKVQRTGCLLAGRTWHIKEGITR